MTNLSATPELLAVASNAAYKTEENLPNQLKQAGFEFYVDPVSDRQGFVEDVETGFAAIIWWNPQTKEYIVATRGTEFGTSQDWYANLNLGKPQFDGGGGGKLKTLIDTFSDDATIHFTGHSLGGALAQYFAFDYADTLDGQTINLTTFNALGGQLFYDLPNTPTLNTSILADINATHYVTSGDSVSKLGDGHLASGGELYVVDSGDKSPIDAHYMSNFIDINLSAISATSIAPGYYLDIDSAQAVASAWGSVFDDGQMGGILGTIEGWARIFAGVWPALLTAPQSEIAGIVEAFLPNSPIDLDSILSARQLVLTRFPAAVAQAVKLEAIAYGIIATTQILDRTNDTISAELAGFIDGAAALAAGLYNLVDSPLQEEISLFIEELAEYYQFIWTPTAEEKVIFGGTDADIIDGEGASDELYGQSGDDTLNGMAGRDFLYGGQGEDALYGGTGNDILSGGNDGDPDTYHYETGDGHDTIIDGDLGGDRILVNGTDLATLDFKKSAKSSNTYTVEGQDISLLKGSLDTVIFIGSDDSTGSITLNSFNDGSFGITLSDEEAVEDPGVPAGAENVSSAGYGAYHNNYFGRVNGENDVPIHYEGIEFYDGLNEPPSTLFWQFMGGDQDDRLIGLDGDFGDEIYGVDGDDYIKGGAGNDVLEGNAGSDTIFGGEGDDFIYGDTLGEREFLDPYDSLAPPLTIPEEEEGDKNYIDGEEGDDFLVGGDYEDIIVGGDNNDTIAGGAGSDILSGGMHNDVIFGDSKILYSIGEELPDSTYELLVEPEYINAEENGHQYGDFIDGGEGDDVLMGEIGDDILHGGKGEDIIFGDRAVDDPDGELAPELNGNDVLFGGEDNDQLTGGGADDVLHGGAGNDVLFGDGDTIPEEFQGDDVLYGGAGDDQLQGGAGDDRLSGDADMDNLLGEKGKDTLYGGAGDDQLSGGQDDDKLWGDSGTDLLLGDEGDDHLYGGAGDDQLQGGDGDDLLIGGSGDDALLGESGDDVLVGGVGTDALLGGAGDDTLTGGGGYDFLQGGAGRDLYTFALGDGGAGIDDTNGASRLRFEGVTSLGGLTIVQNDTDTTVYYSSDQSDWVAMSNTTFNYVTHIELGATTFDRGQLLAASPLIRTGTPFTTIQVTNPVLTAADISVFGRDNNLVIGAKRSNSDTGVIQNVGVHDFLSASDIASYGNMYFQDESGNFVSPDDAENVYFVGWYGGDEATRLSDIEFVNGESLGLVESGIGRTSSATQGLSIYGTALDDELLGGDGFQSMLGQDGNDHLLGLGGRDELHGGNGNDLLEGGGGDDSLYGGAGDDQLLGGAGKDDLRGDDGNDLLYGGEGDGWMNGGFGDDLFVVDDLTGDISISDINGTDRLLFDGIEFEEIYLDRNSDDLHIWIGEKRLILGNAFTPISDGVIEEWAFTSGEVYSWGDLLQSMNLNLAPLVNEPIPDFNLDIDAVLDYRLATGQFVDPDGLDPLRYSYKVNQPDFVSNLPVPGLYSENEAGSGEVSSLGFGFDSNVAEWLSVDANTGAISGTPELTVEGNRILSSDIGEYRVQYNASDRLDGDGLSEFTLSVSDEAPEIDPRVGFDDIQIEAGDGFSFSLPYYDNIFFGNSQAAVSVSLNHYIPEALRNIDSIADIVAGDDYHVSSAFAFDDIVAGDPAELPDWLSYDAASQTFSGTPGIADVDDGFTIHIWMTNGGETFAFEHSIDVSVVGEPTQFSLGDDAFLGIAGQTLDVSFDALLANDIQWDGADLSVIDVASNGEGALEVDYSGELFRYTPAAGETNAILSYQASDATATQAGVVELEFGVGEMLTAGDDYFIGSRADQLVLGGNGNDRINGRGGDDVIGGGIGADTLRGGAGDDSLRGGLGADRLLGGRDSDLLYGNAGDDLLRGGEGSDTYYFGLGDGSETLNNNSTNYLQDIDVLQFMSRLDPDDIWFSRRNDHLMVNVIGSDDSIKLKNWYQDDAFKLDAIMTTDASLDMAALNQLVQAMSAFSPPDGIGVVLPEETRAAVMPIIASAWVPLAS